MIGLDVGVEETVAEAIRQAFVTGETTVTLTATLFPPKTEPTLLTIRPIRGMDSVGIATTTCHATTLAFRAFGVADIISAALAGLPDQAIEFQVTDGDAAHASAAPLSTSAGDDSSWQPAAAAHKTGREALSGYPLLVEVRPTARLLRQHRTGQPWVVFLMGTLLTGVVVAWLIQTERRHDHVARTVAKRTRELATANQSLEAETRRKAAPEARLRESLKMEAVGTLAAGIAHDFNNLLTPNIGSCDLLKLQAQPGDPIHEYAVQITASAERAAQLTRQLLGFARKGKLQHVAVPIDDLVRRVVEFLQRTTAKTIVIQKGLDAAVLGDGMGLAMVYGIARNHGGFVQVVPSATGGTTLLIHLPLATQDAVIRALPGPH